MLIDEAKMARRFPKPRPYRIKNREKYIGNADAITMRSSWERRFAIWCDNNPSVLTWNSEGMPIGYISSIDGRLHRYYIDFFVKLKTKDGAIRKLAIEIKPKEQTMPPNPPKRKTAKTEARYIEECKTFQTNQDKWDAAKDWCRQNGFEFVVLTEAELGI